MPTAHTAPQSLPLPPTYVALDFGHLVGIPGFSATLLSNHFKLYQGYVNNVNTLLAEQRELLKAGQQATPVYAELKRRLGWEFNGMRLHELYFGNMGGTTPINTNSALYTALVRDFGSFEQWKNDFLATGRMRGIGWAVLYKDPVTGRLLNMWINEHEANHPAGAVPLLVMDVFEHAFMTDYQLDRASYLDAFFKTINWPVVESRF
ncbi:MAG: superoxide dismutase [bacterium]|nr:superoxide dismutase [bacterium]